MAFRRFFGGSQQQVQGPTLTECTERVDKRVEALDEKIRKLDVELNQYKQQMSRMRPGPQQNGVKQRAMRVLKQKKMYEQQRDQLMGQAFQMEQTNFMAQGMKDTVTIVQTMKETQGAMKATLKQMKIRDVENLWDEMEDLYEDTNEIQEVLSRSYGLPDELDEADLEAELDALGDDLDWGVEEVPDYLQSAPTPSASPFVGESPIPGSTPPVLVDDYGLPSVPQQQALY
eukprot:CAMPEP_0174251416 /NCGR_PEP_ID=MMETSP0439-20130205/1243_1 /TAXON_ID=0 /ORGANISM="Stereomyxa ramosa, Strain Chinc5" /LENGTH=229 /DNA_ID=CAMNT_0015331719 /DNA_START=35 /DNA_END=727 /DNA_ORIENTATION=+